MKNADEDDPKVAVAARLADGQPVDWSAVARSAHTDAERKFYDRLRAVAEIAKAHAPGAGDDVHGSIRGAQQYISGDRQDPISWGPLRIIEKIGRGSFGDVYRARDPRLDRDVALKLLRYREPPEDQLIVEEARLMARVRHPGVVTIYGAERINGRTGIWMELLSRSVGDEVAQQGPMAAVEAARVAAHVAGALSAIHRAGLIHRDVKAQNVLRDAAGRAVLTDFGTGGELDRSGGPTAGTPLYLAPEVLDGSPATVRSDVYSLGVLLYFLLTGAYPVEGRSTDEVRRAHREHSYVKLATRRPVPPALADIANRALSPDPADRFPDAGSFEHALTAVLQPQSWATLLLLALLAVVGLAIFAAWHTSVVRPNDGSRGLVQVGMLHRNMRYGGVSPDGTSIVCSNAKWRFALCELNSEVVRPIITDASVGFADGAFSQISPDGRRIVYMARSRLEPKAHTTLHVQNIDGTGARQLFTPQPHQWYLRPTAWASRADVLVGDLKDLDEAHRVVLLDPATGAIRVVREFTREQPVESIDISADGRFVVHDLPSGPTWTRDLFVIDVASGRSWMLAGGDSDEISAVWSRDGSRIYFTSDRSGTFGIWSQRVVDGHPLGDPEMIMDTGRDMFSPVGAIGMGSSILYTRRTGGFDGYRANLDLSGATMAVRRLSPRALDQIASPDWSPDGLRLAYLSSPTRIGNRRAATRVVIQDARSGREIDWPIDGQVHQTSIRWWVDGTSVVIRRGAEQRGSIMEQRDALTGHVLREIPIVGAGGDLVPLPDASAVIYTAGSAVHELRLSDMRHRTLMTVEKPWFLNEPAGLSITHDGQRIAVSIYRQNLTGLTARIIARNSGAITEVQFPVKAIPVAWADLDRTLLGVTWGVDPGFRPRVFAFGLSARTTNYLGLSADQIRHVRIHPAGREIVFSAGQSRLDLWLLQNPDR